MKYLNINVSVPVCESPQDVMDMLNSPKILKKVSRLLTKVIGAEIVTEAMQHTAPAEHPQDTSVPVNSVAGKRRV